jgi:hypothetical protein
MISIAILLAGFGGWQLLRLSTAYTADDLTYNQTPKAMQAWLAGLYRQTGTSDERVEKISRRLILMSMPLRRQTVLSMARPEFWTELTSDFRQRVVMQQDMAAAIALALSRAPTNGELWFLSAKLDIDQQGVSDEALKRLGLSAVYAPKAGELALARLLVLQRNWKFLDDEARQVMTRDFSVVAAANPEKADAIAKELAATGLDMTAVGVPQGEQ